MVTTTNIPADRGDANGISDAAVLTAKILWPAPGDNFRDLRDAALKLHGASIYAEPQSEDEMYLSYLAETALELHYAGNYWGYAQSQGSAQ